MPFTAYSDDALLNSLFGKTSNFGALGSAPTFYVGVSSTTPNPNGTGVTEPSGSGYARVATTAASWNASANQDPAWVASTPYALNALIVDSNGNQQKCTTAGTSGGTAPAWNTTLGGTTSDGATLVWTNEGAEPQQITNSAILTFPIATGNWVGGANLTFGVLYSAATSGTLLAYGPITVPKPVLSGDTLSIPIAGCQVQNT